MHAFNVIFWILFASVAAFIGWSFIQIFFEMLRDRRRSREVTRPGGWSNAGTLGNATGGVHAGGDAATQMSGFDQGAPTSEGGSGSESGESNGGDSGGGDFSGGGGESGGGGSSGGW